MDRILAIVFAVFWMLIAWGVVEDASGETGWGPWFLSLIWVIFLALWASSGLKKIDVGFKGQLLFLGGRRRHIFNDEGWRWAPFPFGIKTADCRDKSQVIDALTVLTSDNVSVSVAGTLVSRIEDLDLNFSVDPESIKQGIDDTWDEIIRTQVVGRTFDEVKVMHVDVGEQAKTALETQATGAWGIRVIRIPVTIKPASDEFVKDLELKAREELQRRGQEVELQHFISRVNALMAIPPAGPGLSREQAIEQVQLSLGKATKTIDAKTIALDPVTAGLVGAILAGRR